MRIHNILILALLTVASPAFGQDFVWSENAGWLNWSPGNGVDQGPMYEIDAISGFIWGENIGWVNLGDGASVPPPTMQTGEDFGVGIDADGYLYGYAWGENIGWVNFGPFASAETEPRFRRGRLLGYAWSENIGWINLDDDEHFVQLACPADLNGDGVLNFFDVSDYISRYASGSLRSDWNDDGVLNFFDVSGFIFDYGQGCP